MRVLIAIAKPRRLRHFCLLTILVLSSVAGNAQEITNIKNSESDLREALARFSTDRAALLRSYDISLSALKSDRMQRFYQGWQASLEKVEFKSLNQEGKIDYLLFRNLLQYQSWRLEEDKRRLEEVDDLLPVIDQITRLEEDRRLMKPIDSEKAASALASMQERLLKTRHQLQQAINNKDSKAALDKRKTQARRAAGLTRELRESLETWYSFYNEYDPMFTWWAQQPYQKLGDELEKHEKFLRAKLVGVTAADRSGPVIGDPIGRDALMRDLAMEMVPYTPEELLDIGWKEYAWCEKEMISASRDLGYGDDWLKALEYVKTLHMPPGEQPKLIREQALEAIEFVESRGLLTVPEMAKETWRIEMMSPTRQLINPFFTGGEVIRVSFPTAGMDHEQKRMSMRGNNIHFSRATVHHELIPGHHLQGYMRARHNTHRRLFRTPFWGEGWALYWEMLLWDLDFPKSPENRIGMLFWRMHRAARIIFSLSFHLEKMTAQECIEFLVHRVGHERDNATAEVRRSFETNYSPLYQCAYMLGGLQIRSLHAELVQSGKMNDRAFHDAILIGNSMPIEMVRARLLKSDLNEDYVANWRFYR